MGFSRSQLWDLFGGGGAQSPAAAAPRDWAALKAAYDYDRGCAFRAAEERRPHGEHYRARLRFTRADGHGLAGLFFRPAAAGRYPCVLLLHALSSDKEEMARHFGPPLAARGVASLALDAHLHGERAPATAEETLDLPDYVDLARESIVEYRQALDYLATRPDVDAGRTGLLGYSLGAMMGTILAAVDERVRAALLMVGGDLVRPHWEEFPPPLRQLLEPVSPAAFAPHVSPRPVFFLNGTRDTTVPRAAAALLHEAAREPKRVEWVAAGHRLPEGAVLHGVEWLADQLSG